MELRALSGSFTSWARRTAEEVLLRSSLAQNPSSLLVSFQTGTGISRTSDTAGVD